MFVAGFFGKSVNLAVECHEGDTKERFFGGGLSEMGAIFNIFCYFWGSVIVLGGDFAAGRNFVRSFQQAIYVAECCL